MKTFQLFIFLASVSVIAEEMNISQQVRMGICEPISRIGWRDIGKTCELIKKTGVKRIREWADFSFLFDEKGNIRMQSAERLKKVIELAAENSIELLLLEDGSYPPWMTGCSPGKSARFPVPRKNKKNPGAYDAFLSRYKEAWRLLGKNFPEIKHWQIENEVNFERYLYPEKGAFTETERVEIYADLLCGAYKILKEVNPEVSVVAAAIAGIGPDSRLFMKKFLREIKRRKTAGIVRECFDILAWHPYINEIPTYKSFIIPNQKMKVILEREGFENFPVYLTEFGFSERMGDGLSVKTILSSMDYVFNKALLEFDWLEALYWFRLIDATGVKKNDYEKSFGLFYSEDSRTPFEIKAQGKKFLKLSEKYGSYSKTNSEKSP